jgi:hypothetical protein
MRTMPIRAMLTATAPLAACVLLAAGVATTTLAADGQPPEPAEPLAVVESFLLARDMRDAWGAAIWCAALLELQDVDGSWFVDTPTTSDWLRQLTDRYFIERLDPLVAEGDTVSWTERLSRRSLPYPEALRSSVTIEVHAVVRAGRIAYLSGPYPPVPLLRPTPTTGEPGTGASAGSSPTVGPATLFVGSALGLSLTALLAARGGPLVRGAVQRGSHGPSRHGRVRR